ncbi:hypothetical protein [Azospirillum griseum]|uniref:Uncharacterized protein n=1 Tax=Azospirillum griseum TaxID=2496639 RepID=A0A3S0L0I2_9PROT|nr:hypothetical protein [Azospirillum griseum]RTR23055.1 hypothetical protein EJ903_05680 [Azospirillum griseum]
MADVMIRIWGEWHPFDATVRSRVPLGTPLTLYVEGGDGPGWTWTGGGRVGIEDHRPGALACAECAITGADSGYVIDGNAYAPLRWYRDRQGIEAYFTDPLPSNGTATGEAQ